MSNQLRLVIAPHYYQGGIIDEDEELITRRLNGLVQFIAGPCINLPASFLVSERIISIIPRSSQSCGGSSWFCQIKRKQIIQALEDLHGPAN
jgi:hypothetical protein